ncbi:MAG: RHS repeat protein [Candidatus Hydrogenedentes bacterium]|nr:RHS repeat protein [Candidatus Hydrogenedentota bacterium]
MHSPGVNVDVHSFQSALVIDEPDLAIGTRGPMGVALERDYVNRKGFHRDEFTDTSKVWGNVIGGGWVHSYNIFLRTSTEATPPATVIFSDKFGSPLYYEYVDTSGGYDNYRRTSKAITEHLGTTLRRNTSTGKYYLDMPGGIQYGFSAPTADSNKYCRLETTTDASSNQIALEYNGAVGTGRLTKVTPPSGDDRYLQFSYSGNLITKVELKKSGGTVVQTVSYAYNASNELTKVTDNDSKTVQYTYWDDPDVPGARFIDGVTDKKGTTTSLAWYFDYDYLEAYRIDVDNAAGLRNKNDRSVTTSINTVTDYIPAGATLAKMKYTPQSASGWHLQYVDVYKDTTNYDRYTYNYAGNRDLTKTQRPGTVDHVSMTYTTKGRLSKAHSGSDGDTIWSYATDGLYPTKMTDRAGLDTTYSYDGSNRLTKTVTPWSGSNGIVYAYDSYGQATSVTNPLSQATTFVYDARGNITSAKNPQDNETKLEYDDLGNVTKATDPNNKVTTYYYAYSGCGGCGGKTGQLTKVKDPLNNETLFYYDQNGNQTKVTDALNRSTDYAYDLMNQLTKVTSPSGGSTNTTMEFDKLGKVTKQTSFDGKVQNLYYDFQGQLTKQDDSVGNVQYTFDSYGNLSTVTDGGGNVTDYDYDNQNRLTKMNYAHGKVTKYFYDNMGRVTKVGAGSDGTVDPTEYFYSGSTCQMTKVRYTAEGNTYDGNYAYNSSGRLTKLTDWIDATNGLQYAYNTSGKLTKITDYDASTLDYTYDAAGNVITMDDYHGNLVTYTYTDRGQVSTITSPGSKTWTYSYNANGQPTQYTHPNGMTTAYSYDDRNRLTKIEHKDGSTVLDGFTYALDKDGNITKTTHQDNSYWDYYYDGRSRLTKAERKDSSSNLLKRWTYTYSAADNMTTKEVYTPPSTTDTYVYAYNTGNELTKQTLAGTDTSFAYDSWGRMTSKTQGSYSATYYYNYGDKLTKVSSNFTGEGTVTYKVGADQKRRERNPSGGSITKFNWDAGWNVISEENSSDTLTMTYVHDPVKSIGTVLADVSGSNPGTGTYRYHSQDNIGSTRRLRDSNKSSVGQYEYEPYGSVYSESGATITDKFTGHDWDTLTETYYTVYRPYSPTLARWLARDPFAQPEVPSFYGYVLWSPIVMVDRTGGIIQLPPVLVGWFILCVLVEPALRHIISETCINNCPDFVVLSRGHPGTVTKRTDEERGHIRIDTSRMVTKTVTFVGYKEESCINECIAASQRQGAWEQLGHDVIRAMCIGKALYHFLGAFHVVPAGGTVAAARPLEELIPVR